MQGISEKNKNISFGRIQNTDTPQAGGWGPKEGLQGEFGQDRLQTTLLAEERSVRCFF